MHLEEIKELHYICLIKNLKSILEHGILCHNSACKIDNIDMSFADSKVQERRRKKLLPNGRALHEYVNLYFDARTPTLFKRIDPRGESLVNELCVCQVDPAVLDRREVWVTDMNAAASIACFYTVFEGLPKLDKKLVYARSWKSDDAREYDRRKKMRCAEVLVPDKVTSQLIIGVKGGSSMALESIGITMNEVNRNIPVLLDKDLFFQQ